MTGSHSLRDGPVRKPAAPRGAPGGGKPGRTRRSDTQGRADTPGWADTQVRADTQGRADTPGWADTPGRADTQVRPYWGAAGVRQATVVFATLLSLFPVYFMAVSAFKTKSQYLANKWGLPLQPTLANFTTALAGEKFFVRFANSLILTVGAVVLSTIIASLAAYAFARMPFPGKKTLFNLVIALMVVPPVVMVVPLFVSMVSWQMVNTYHGVILIYVGLLMPFSVYLMTNFFKTVPREIIEAARMDGCSTLDVFRLIMTPLSAPAVLTLVVVNAMWVWNELLIALIFLQRDELKTLMVGIASMRSRNYVDIPATMAGLLVATIPIVILYLFGQRYFIRGLTSGAVK